MTKMKPIKPPQLRGILRGIPRGIWGIPPRFPGSILTQNNKKKEKAGIIGGGPLGDPPRDPLGDPPGDLPGDPQGDPPGDPLGNPPGDSPGASLGDPVEGPPWGEPPGGPGVIRSGGGGGGGGQGGSVHYQVPGLLKTSPNAWRR